MPYKRLFALRLDIYKGFPLSEGIKVIIVKILVNILRVCAASHKLFAIGSIRARLSKKASNILFEDPSVTALIDKLEELTSQEHKIVSAQNLSITTQALTQKAYSREPTTKRSERGS